MKPFLYKANSQGFRYIIVSAAMTALLGGCQTLDQKNSAKNSASKEIAFGKRLGDQVIRPSKTGYVSTSPFYQGVVGATDADGRPLAKEASSGTISLIGRVPVISDRPEGLGDVDLKRGPASKTRRVSAQVNPLPLSVFIETVFAEMLQVPYATGPNIANRTEMIRLNSSGEMSSREFLELISLTLEEYGVRVFVEDDKYLVIEDKALKSRIPRFIKSRARLGTPDALQPVVQFVELQAVDANSMLEFLQQAFGRNSDKLTIKSSPRFNYVSLSGLPEEVDKAVQIIRELDELQFAGSQVLRYRPKYWRAEEFSEALSNALSVEGWMVSSDPNLSRTIFVMPTAFSNDVFIFSKSNEANERVNNWIQNLDRPADGVNESQIFVYQVRNIDAELIAEIANRALSNQRQRDQRGSSSSGRGGGAGNAIGGQTSGFANANLGGDIFTVDTLGNRIIFSGDQTDNERYTRLLRQLDTPAPEVLIELQIAEVTLNDSTSIGVELSLDDLGDERVRGTFDTDGLGIGGNGLTVGLVTGNIDATLNAFADNRQIRVLSTPILTARSGGTADIQVGTDVPIITSQRAASNQNGGGETDILQQIDYRKTGQIVSLSPIVFSRDRIDLDISVEVSATVDTGGSSLGTPTISNRTVTTQLTLEDGETAVLGGLMQDNQVLDDEGVPFLKDLPFVGQAFARNAISRDKTELIILITPYVLRGQEDKNQFVNLLRNRVEQALTEADPLITLLPRAQPSEQKLGSNLRRNGS